MTVDTRSYTSGNFELQIDGHDSTAYLKSVDGGFTRAAVVSEPIGTHNGRIKHIGPLDIEPFTAELGMAGSEDILAWIQSSWKKDWGRRNGQITHADFDLDSTFEYQFFDALIAETTFPTLDGASKDAAYLKVKVQPEKVIAEKAGGVRLQSKLGPKQKMWMPSGFRLKIDGIDGMEYANKIDSFTVKQGIKKYCYGEDRNAQCEPTMIEFPHISGTIALAYAGNLLDWYKTYVVKGQADPKAQKSGVIEFLAPNRNDVIFRINLCQVAVHHAQIMQSGANSNQIKRVKFELYVHHMELDGPGQLGLE